MEKVLKLIKIKIVILGILKMVENLGKGIFDFQMEELFMEFEN